MNEKTKQQAQKAAEKQILEDVKNILVTSTREYFDRAYGSDFSGLTKEPIITKDFIAKTVDNIKHSLEDNLKAGRQLLTIINKHTQEQVGSGLSIEEMLIYHFDYLENGIEYCLLDNLNIDPTEATNTTTEQDLKEGKLYINFTGRKLYDFTIDKDIKNKTITINHIKPTVIRQVISNDYVASILDEPT